MLWVSLKTDDVPEQSDLKIAHFKEENLRQLLAFLITSIENNKLSSRILLFFCNSTE
jgi:hypothetical protein